MAKKSEKSKSPRRYTPRQTRKFQLRLDHPLDVHVAEVLGHARARRREVTIIREGIALWWALENGDLEYLFEKFPQYRAHFNPDVEELIDQFRQMLQQQAKGSEETGTPVLPAGKTIDTPKFALPVFDDEDDQDTLVIKRDTSTAASDNFMKAILSLQQ